MAGIKLLSRDSSLLNNQVSSKEYICKSIREQLHELVYWQKISHPVMRVLSRPSWEAGRKCMHALSMCVQQDLCFPELSYLLHRDSHSSHLTEGVLDKTLSFLKDTSRKTNSFTQSKMLNRENFLILVKP